jgi:hypothetical protein
VVLPVIPTTTTVPPTTTSPPTTAAPSGVVVLPASGEVTPPTTAAPAPAPTPPTVASAPVVLPETVAAPAPAAALPLTGSDVRGLLLLAGVFLVLGGLSLFSSGPVRGGKPHSAKRIG